MLPRRLRLTRTSFPKGGGRAQTQHFSAVFGASAQGGGAAAVVSKKVARRAVARNLIRRRMLEVMRPYALPQRFLVVYARAGSQNLSYNALARELTPLLDRITSHNRHA